MVEKLKALSAVNYRLKEDDIAYIMAHADVDMIIVDREFAPLLGAYSRDHPGVPVLVDSDTDATEGELTGPFDDAVLEGLRFDAEHGARGWLALETQPADETAVIALAYTSGTTARPKGVEFTHRGAYLAALGNVVESGLAFHKGRCRYLWTLPMFHAMGISPSHFAFLSFLLLILLGWTFPWAITAARGTHYCLRKIDYARIWQILKEEHITHFNAAPTVNTLLCAAPEAERLPEPVRVTVAASPPTAHLFEQMTNLNLHPVHVYGMTETYGPITKGYYMPEWDSIPAKEKYERMARQGHGFITSLPVRVVKTDDVVPEGTLVDVQRNGKEIGEIVFVGNICARGYYKDPEATRRLFAGGVLHSGDLAVWHPDGAVQILDRAKDIIISGMLPCHCHCFAVPCSSLPLFAVLLILTTPSQAAKTYRRWPSKQCSPPIQTSSRPAWWPCRTPTGGSGPRPSSPSNRAGACTARTSSTGRGTTAASASSWCLARSRS